MSPVADDSPASSQLLQVAPSAPMELLWLGHALLNPGASVAKRLEVLGGDQMERLARRMRTFWGDEFPAGAAELVILADFAGRLFDTDLEPLLEELPVPEADLSQLRLRSEDPADRIRFIERLTRLQTDAKLRRRYGDLLRQLWEPLREEWEGTGLPQMLSTCQHVSHRLEQGASLEEAVPVVAELVRKRADWGGLIEEASGKERLALVPGFFGGRWSLWDLPLHMVVGFNEEADSVAYLRDRGRQLARRLRVLGDPTRLTILLYLAESPISVGEIATRFALAQPTVSAHLRALREASLVTARRDAGRTLYRTERAEVARLLRDLASSSGIDLRS